MSTASSRHLEKGHEAKLTNSRGSSESLRATISTSTGGASPSGPKLGAMNSHGGSSGSLASPVSKTRLSTSTSRGGLTADGNGSPSSSSSSPASSLSSGPVLASPPESLLLNLPVASRSSTTATKRVLSLDDESRDSSRSKDGDDSSENEPISPLLDDAKLGKARSTSRRVSSSRGLPSIFESDSESSTTATARRKKKRNSQRSAPTPSRGVSSDLGYTSESTSRDEASTSPGHTPIAHSSQTWGTSYTGPVPPTSSSSARDRSASRSESPIESLKLRVSRTRTRSERRNIPDATSSEPRIPDRLDESLEYSVDGPLSDRRPSPSKHVPDIVNSASSTSLSVNSARGPSRKKSKRPSKHEMLALHGVWAYERDGKMQIFGGTTSKIMGKLLDLLVTSPDRDHIYFLVHIFLHGARQFYNAAELLSVLLKYWDLKGDYENPCGGNLDVVRSSIIFFLAAWFEKRFVVDFGNALDSAKPALEKFMRKLNEQYVGPLQAKLKRYTAQEIPIPSVVFIKPLSISLPNHLSLIDVKPVVLAGQWTLLDMRNFQSIQLSEFYSTSAEDRPEWSRMLSRGETLTKWLAMSIVQQTQLSHRTKALKRAIDLAVKFLELNNFHGLMCTWGAINTNAVHRLTKTFKKLPKASTEILKSLEEKLSEANNFANLRWSIHKQRSQANAPLVPWFELTAKNRNMLDEYDDVVLPPDFRVTFENRDTALFAFSKFAKFADQIEEFLACQHNNRLLDLHSTQTHTSETIIQKWLSDLQVQDEDELWRLSLLCEPLESLHSDSSSSTLN